LYLPIFSRIAMSASINQMDMMAQLKIKIPSPALKDQAGKGEVKRGEVYSDDPDFPDVASTKPIYIKMAPTNSLI
jgi:hypothetical protein